MDTTTPNIVGPTMMGFVASMFIVECKQIQQLPTMLGSEEIKGRIQAIRLCRPRIMHVHSPNNNGRAVQKDTTLLLYASAIMEQEKLWELLVPKFDCFQTLHNNSQQHATGWANGHNILATTLGVVGQQCCVCLQEVLLSFIEIPMLIV